MIESNLLRQNAVSSRSSGCLSAGRPLCLPPCGLSQTRERKYAAMRPREGPLRNFDLDESPEAPPVSEQIIGALIANAGKVLDLFRSWDVNEDGLVTRAEFHEAMHTLGLDVPPEAIDQIFTRWDRDGGDTLSVPELTKILRAASTTSKNLERLRKICAKQEVKAQAILRDHDTDDSGDLSSAEFAQAIVRLVHAYAYTCISCISCTSCITCISYTSHASHARHARHAVRLAGSRAFSTDQVEAMFDSVDVDRKSG